MHRNGVDDELVGFLRTVQPRLSRLALMLTGDHANAEDLVQDTMVRVARRWSTVRDASSPEAYACRVAINQWHDQVRKRRARPVEVVLHQDGSHDSDERLEEGVLDRVTMRAALRELTAKQRAVLFLRYYEERSVREVAHILECSEGTVKSQTSYALRVLSRSGALAPVDKRS